MPDTSDKPKPWLCRSISDYCSLLKEYDDDYGDHYAISTFGKAAACFGQSGSGWLSRAPRCMSMKILNCVQSRT